MKFSLLLVVVAACGPASSSPTDDGHTSDGAPGGQHDGGGSNTPSGDTDGTRIKLKTVTTTVMGADGSSHSSTFFGGYFDSQRNEACAPALASDGTTRCLPSAYTIYGSYFADAACTVPVLYVTHGTCNFVPPKYLAVVPPPPQTCSSTPVGQKIYATGSVITTAYQKSGTSCTGPTTSTTFDFYPIAGTELSPSLFVEMTQTSTTSP